ncbi:mediator of RNA polymerase II transcription subunit 24-like [Leptopilina boulardi]|uniref:mediator of RNA polymerase II transcription subunit 24-like n=1 Tax=Leptopilina boulardi TaxID=63433 RepID=UPI0021F5E2CB|nr:mediator of RNA polymerase II transcription subunit 24-like [Leptopilina boulardi]
MPNSNFICAMMYLAKHDDKDLYGEVVKKCQEIEVQSLLAVQGSLNSSTETATFVSQLQMVQRLKNYTNARLYCELIRASLMSLHRVTGSFSESHW